MLTVISQGEDYISPKNKHGRRWLCQCECGNTKLIHEVSLIHGKAKSCGCLQRELAAERVKDRAAKQAIDITGQRFGKLVAVERVGKAETGGYLWRCKCDCGNEVIRLTKVLRSGSCKSCGCLVGEKLAEQHYKHGKSHSSRLYHVWDGMRQRCNDPNHKSYKNYGGRGIRCCPEWDDFTAFEAWALENGYDANAEYGECTLDRIDVNGNYEPGNCRWVDNKTQAQNKRNSTR